MTSRELSEQQRITLWFDQVYQRKGDRYLRPVQAYYVFLELLQVKAGRQLLDVACGPGRLLAAAREYDIDLFGIDISTNAIRRAAQQLPDANLQVGNAEQIPFADATFDYVSCVGSLERMLDRPRALREIHRVSKADAGICFLVRNSNTFSWRFLTGSTDSRHARGHQDADSLSNWQSLFEAAGFDIVEILPDQYPLHQRVKWSRLGFGTVDYRTPIRPSRPLGNANEFLFLLRKSP